MIKRAQDGVIRVITVIRKLMKGRAEAHPTNTPENTGPADVSEEHSGTQQQDGVQADPVPGIPEEYWTLNLSSRDLFDIDDADVDDAPTWAKLDEATRSSVISKRFIWPDVDLPNNPEDLDVIRVFEETYNWVNALCLPRDWPVIHVHSEYLRRLQDDLSESIDRHEDLGLDNAHVNRLRSLRLLAIYRDRAFRRIMNHYVLAFDKPQFNEATAKQLEFDIRFERAFKSKAALENFDIALKLVQGGTLPMGARKPTITAMWKEIAKRRGLRDTTGIIQSAHDHGWYFPNITLEEMKQKILEKAKEVGYLDTNTNLG